MAVSDASVPKRPRAQDGLRASEALKAAGLRGVDDFIRACKRSSRPDRTYVSEHDLNMLTSANINYMATDKFAMSLLRHFGLKAYQPDIKRCIPSQQLANVYTRINQRRPTSVQPAPFTPTVRTILQACITEHVALTPDALISHIHKYANSIPLAVAMSPACTYMSRVWLASVIARCAVWAIRYLPLAKVLMIIPYVGQIGRMSATSVPWLVFFTSLGWLGVFAYKFVPMHTKPFSAYLAPGALFAFVGSP